MGQVIRNSGKKREKRFDLWIYNNDLNDAIKEFVRM